MFCEVNQSGVAILSKLSKSSSGIFDEILFFLCFILGNSCPRMSFFSSFLSPLFPQDTYMNKAWLWSRTYLSGERGLTKSGKEPQSNFWVNIWLQHHAFANWQVWLKLESQIIKSWCFFFRKLKTNVSTMHTIICCRNYWVIFCRSI